MISGRQSPVAQCHSLPRRAGLHHHGAGGYLDAGRLHITSLDLSPSKAGVLGSMYGVLGKPKHIPTRAKRLPCNIAYSSLKGEAPEMS